MISIPFRQFGNIRQDQDIAAGGYDTIFYFEIPPGYVAFLWYLYAEWYYDTYLVMKIDGEIVETIRRQIGEVNKPFKFHKPYLITRDIEFIGYNNSDESHTFEVLCDGEVYDETMARQEIWQNQ